MKSKKKSPDAAALRVAAVDLDEVERLLDFMSQHGLEEFEYARGDLRIRLKKQVGGSNSLAQHSVSAQPVAANPTSSPGGELLAAVPVRGSAAETAPAEDLHIIKSPIVGTFYEGPAPEGEPFVRVGDHVTVGHVLCIIEAMKLMNEIESDVEGEVIRIDVVNGQPVEYGEYLFAIRPARKP